MGIMAKMRQLYHEAERRHRIEALYAENPAGLERPSYDAAHYAFFPAIEGKKPILYFVDSALEAHRALRLQEDLGFPLMLAGLNQGFDATEELKRAKPPLFLTLNMPEDPKWMAKMKEDSLDAIIASYDREERAATYRDLEAEKRNLQARQLISRKEYYATAANLHNEGLTFGFTTMGAKPADLHKNLRKIIENGLPEDAALAALTTNAAQILGVSQMLGTIEEGKIANLVVTKGPYFEEKSQIRYVVVDGTRYEYELKKERSTETDEDKEEPADPGS
jgi:hypothetical protein